VHELMERTREAPVLASSGAREGCPPNLPSTEFVSGNTARKPAVLVSCYLPFWRKRDPGPPPADTSPQSRLELFEEMVLPHLNSAHNFARWLTRNEDDAQDLVQESYLRAFRFFDSYKGGDGKAWILAIVRNTCRTSERWRNAGSVPFDETRHGVDTQMTDQEQNAADQEKLGVLRGCIEQLPVEFREVLIMRELEEMSYREIADTTGISLGTVMSRLSRARKRLEACAARRIVGAAG
jgi:RNA polymerase sigma factor (sigma-70 family)